MRTISKHQADLFLSLLKERNIEIHSLCLYQDGALLLDDTFEPFQRGALHPLYSITKSFTSIAIGLLIQDHKLQLEDRWCDFFPEYKEKITDPKFLSVTIKDLLTMTLGQDREVTVESGDDWIENILSKPLAYRPSEKFFYNSMCSMLLSVLIQKLTGCKEADFLDQRIFQPLRIHNWYWEEDEQGHSIGGYGLHLEIHDLLKFGIFLLKEGKYNGVKLLDPEWIHTATSHQVDTKEYFSSVRNEDRQGYGFHFWMCTHGAYRCSGMFGQICLIIPDERIVLAVNSSTTGSQPILDCFFEAYDHPNENILHTYHIDLPNGKSVSPWSKLLFGTFQNCDSNNPCFLKINQISNLIDLEWNSKEQTKKLSCGFNKWIQQSDTYSSAGNFILQPEMKKINVNRCLYASYAWPSDTMLMIDVRADDYSGRERILLQLDGKYLKITHDILSFACKSPHEEFVYKKV